MFCAPHSIVVHLVMFKVLAIITDGFEEIETVTPIDILRRAGIEVSLVSLGKDLLVTGRTGITIQADKVLDDRIAREPFDCLLLPGGPHVKLLRCDPRVKDLVLHFSKADRWIAAICAAPLLLNDAGLLADKRYTAHFSAAIELPAIIAEERVVCDGKFITSRGAGTSVDFGLAMVEKMLTASKAKEVSEAICA